MLGMYFTKASHYERSENLRGCVGEGARRKERVFSLYLAKKGGLSCRMVPSWPLSEGQNKTGQWAELSGALKSLQAKADLAAYSGGAVEGMAERGAAALHHHNLTVPTTVLRAVTCIRFEQLAAVCGPRHSWTRHEGAQATVSKRKQSQSPNLGFRSLHKRGPRPYLCKSKVLSP